MSIDKLIKPSMLKKGDKVATVSLSWGGAGDPGIRERYEIGKKRLKDDFGLEVVEMPHTLKGTEYVYAHPKERAEEWMEAFKDPSIKAIISCIGGDETLRLLPYIDFEVIRSNPKIFMGYSDTTVNHFMCLKAGLSSLYGPTILAEFAENVEMLAYTKAHVNKALFDASPIGEIASSPQWTSERLEWHLPENNRIKRKMNEEMRGIECLNGSGKVTGRLIGGCLEVVDLLRGTQLWPSPESFDGAILFLETSEEKPEPSYVLQVLRAFVAMGVIDRINGIIFSKPLDEAHYEGYKDSIKTAIVFEAGFIDLPILYNLNFGHASPICVLPYGALAEIDSEAKRFTILESAVI